MSVSQSPHRPVHFYVEDGCYFITAATHQRQPLLREPARRDWFLDCLAQQAQTLNAELVAWVILPDHYHVLLRVRDPQTIPQLLQDLHRLSAAHFNREDGTPGRQVWYTYWDRCLWTEGDFWSRINYIHRNPVKHGYAAAPEEWLHSSWSRFADHEPDSEAAEDLSRFPRSPAAPPRPLAAMPQR